MEHQIVNTIISSEIFGSLDRTQKQNIQKELLKHFTDLSSTAIELGININELWKIYLSKCDYNKLDLREGRHIMDLNNPLKNISCNTDHRKPLNISCNTDHRRLRMVSYNMDHRKPLDNSCNISYNNQQGKIDLVEKQKDQLKNEYISQSLQIQVRGYDMNTKQHRQVNRETEFLLAFFQNEDDVKKLSDMVPPYIKYKNLKCSNIYLIDIPYQCVDKFEELFMLIVPKRNTVMIGIDNYSPKIMDVNPMQIGVLKVAFIDSSKAEELDDEYPNKFWFFENYSPKRGYHFVYSNSRNTIK